MPDQSVADRSGPIQDARGFLGVTCEAGEPVVYAATASEHVSITDRGWPERLDARLSGGVVTITTLTGGGDVLDELASWPIPSPAQRWIFQRHDLKRLLPDSVLHVLHNDLGSASIAAEPARVWAAFNDRPPDSGNGDEFTGYHQSFQTGIHGHPIPAEATAVRLTYTHPSGAQVERETETTTC